MGYALVVLGGVFAKRRAGLVIRPVITIAKVAGVAIAAFGIVAICTHATKPKACPEGTPLTVNCTQPLGLPLAAVLMLVFLVGLTFLAKRTTFGRHVYAVGGNAEAARRAGINVARVRILVFMISGIMAGVGGLVLAARLQSVNLNVGGGTLLLDSISAAVIGGVSLFGGRGEVRGALLGSLIIATIANGLNIGGYSTGTIYVVTGVILLAAVTLDTIARRLQERAGPLAYAARPPTSTIRSAATFARRSHAAVREPDRRALDDARRVAEAEVHAGILGREVAAARVHLADELRPSGSDSGDDGAGREVRSRTSSQWPARRSVLEQDQPSADRVDRDVEVAVVVVVGGSEPAAVHARRLLEPDAPPDRREAVGAARLRDVLDAPARAARPSRGS